LIDILHKKRIPLDGELMKRKWLAVGIILLFVGVTIAPAMAQNIEKQSSRGNWLYVGGSGPGNYTRIQDAISHSNDGDTIIVYDDSSPYREFITIDKSINLIGEDKNTTIIEGYDDNQKPIIQINADSVHLHGFTIRNSTFYYPNEFYNAIVISSDNNDISRNILMDNRDGIFLNHSSGNKIFENSINQRRFISIGINIWYGGKNKIYNNSISEVLEGIVIHNSRFNKIYGNSLSQIDWGIYIENSVDVGDSGPRYWFLCNFIFKNHVSGAERGVRLEECRFNIIYQNEITNCELGIDRYSAGFIFVIENNFINNTCHAYIFNHMSRNHWSRNYWDDWNGSGYYTIYGKTGGPWWYDPIEEYDKFPAEKPYDIPGVS
jgi:parallel beta-helix repeat protein